MDNAVMVDTCHYTVFKPMGCTIPGVITNVNCRL